MQHKIKTSVFVFFIGIFLIPLFVHGQSKGQHEMVGTVRDNHGNIVQNASVYNLTRGDIISTGQQGNFRIKVYPGDTISLISNNYEASQFVVPEMQDPYLFENFTMNFNPKEALQSFLQDKQVVSQRDTQIWRQNIILAGRVINTNGEALVDANISIGRAMKGTVSNKNGVYEIEVSPGDSVYFSFMGHQPQVVYIANEGKHYVMKDVMLLPSAFMLDGVKVTADKALLNLDFSKVPMDASEASRFVLRNQALQTDKTYFPMVGVSTATFGGLAEIFGSRKNKPKKMSQKALERQQIMRQKVLEMEQENASEDEEEGNL